MRSAFVTASAGAALMLAACGEEATKNAEEAVEEAKTAPASAEAAEGAEGDAAHGETAGDAAAGGPTPEELEKIAAENLAAAEKFLAENAQAENVKVTESGLQYEILEEGPDDGFTPKAEDIVHVHYVGTLTDGVEFDSSRARGAAAKFPLNQVIPGWTEGVQLMSEGDRFRFFIPPELAYGERGAGPIEPNSALIFDVELLKVDNAERNLAAAEAFLSENAAKEGVQTTESGLQYRVVTEGPADGKTPNDASKVKVHYKGTLINGAEFDSSIARGEPAEFPVANVIPGWTEGLQLMSEGDKFEFFIHPDLAYGERPHPRSPIGPNDALVFEVELLEVQE